MGPYEHYNQVHLKPWFLVWHRIMLFFMEHELQAVGPTVTIPYWDWTSYSHDPWNDVALSNRMFGNQRIQKRLRSGWSHFRNFPVFYWHSGRHSAYCLIRHSNIFLNPFTSARAIDRNYLNEPNIARFAEAIELVPHATTRNNIGGEFAGHTSPGDPLFYSHHAFVDKLWFDWQNRHREKYHTYHLDLDANVPVWGLKVRQALDPISNLCYRYPMEHFIVSPPLNATDDELMLHAKNFILKGLNNQTIFNPLPIDFIRTMGYDQAKVRQLERRDPVLIASRGDKF
ncbi:hypothetical protein L0F63_001724 [Massospora cicadina]|nr:hypothetical protein L0F63_001724 [Massospora cicadina]